MKVERKGEEEGVERRDREDTCTLRASEFEREREREEGERGGREREGESGGERVRERERKREGGEGVKIAKKVEKTEGIYDKVLRIHC